MGQFLAIGLATEIGIRKPETGKEPLSIDRIQEEMEYDLNFVPDIYTADEKEHGYLFSLKEDIFYSQHPPLLKELYPLLSL